MVEYLPRLRLPWQPWPVSISQAGQSQHREHSRRWTSAFTRKPPDGEELSGVKHLEYPLQPGDFRVFNIQSASNHACLKFSNAGPRLNG